MRKIIFLTLGKLFGVLALLASVRLMTELLTPKEIGFLNLLLSAISGFITLLIAPVGTYFVRHTIEWLNDGYLFDEIKNLSLYLLLLAIVINPIIFIGAFAKDYILHFGLVWLVILINGQVIFGSIQKSFTSTLNILGSSGWYVLMSNTAMISGIVFAAVLAWSHDGSAQWWYTGIVIGDIVTIPVVILLLRRTIKQTKVISHQPRRVPGLWSRELFAFSWPLAIVTLFYWIPMAGYRFFLKPHASDDIIGLLTVGLTIGMTPMMLFNQVAQDFIVPRFYQETVHCTEDFKITTWNRMSSFYLPVIVVSGCIVAGSADALMHLLVGNIFWKSSWLIPFGVVIQVNMIGYSLYNLLAASMLNNRVLVLANIVGGTAAGVLTFWFSIWDPQAGTASALVISAGLILTIVSVQCHKKHPSLRFPLGSLLHGLLWGFGGIVLMHGLENAFDMTSPLHAIVVLLAGGIYWFVVTYFLWTRLGPDTQQFFQNIRHTEGTVDT